MLKKKLDNEGTCAKTLFPQEGVIKTSVCSASIFIYKIVSLYLSHEIALQ